MSTGATHAAEPVAPRGGGPVLAALLGALAFLLCVFPTRSGDLWWHLLAGAEIAGRGAVPRTDWFSYASADRPWIDLHWGFQLALHGLHRLGGLDLVILAKAGVVAAAVLALLGVAGRRLAAPVATLLLAPVALVASGQADVRPGVVSLLLLALALVAAERAEERPRAALWLAPLVLAWTNVQGVFALGLVVAGALAADRLVRTVAAGRWGLAPLPAGALGPALLALVLAGAAPLANPWGLDGALFPLELLRKLTVDRELYAGVVEFQRPVDFARGVMAARGTGVLGALGAGFLGPELLLAALAWGSFLPLLVRGRRGGRGRWSPFRAAVLAAFTWLAWAMMRNSGPFAIAAGAVLLANARDAVVAGALPDAGRSARASLAAAAALALCVASVPAGLAGELAGDGRRLALGEARAWFLHGPARFACAPGMPAGAVVSLNEQAAVYLWHSRGERRVLLDGRLEVPTRETFRRYVGALDRMAAGDPGFEDLVRLPDGGLPAVLLDSRYSRAEIAGLLSLRDRWRLVFADPSGCVFLDVATAERLGLPEADAAPLADPPLPI